MLYRLYGFYCCVTPCQPFLTPNFYRWSISCPPPLGMDGGSAIIKISAKEMKIISCIESVRFRDNNHC